MSGLSDLSCAQVRYAHKVLKNSDITNAANITEAMISLVSEFGKKSVLNAANGYSIFKHLEEFDGNLTTYIMSVEGQTPQPQLPPTQEAILEPIPMTAHCYDSLPPAISKIKKEMEETV